MVEQKGFDLLAALGERLAGLDASFVVLGTGDADLPVFLDVDWRPAIPTASASGSASTNRCLI